MLFILQFFTLALWIGEVRSDENSVFKRANNQNNFPWYLCGPYGYSNNNGQAVYSKSEVLAAALQGYSLVSNDEKISGKVRKGGKPARKYPAQFDSASEYWNIDFRFLEEPRSLLEFPIVKGRPTFSADDDQGLDRVIFDERTGIFVAVMTHRGNEISSVSELYPCYGQDDEPPSGGGAAGLVSIPVPMFGNWGLDGSLPGKKKFVEETETVTPEDLNSTGPSSPDYEPWLQEKLAEFSTTCINIGSCDAPGCVGSNSAFNETFGICQNGTCTGQLCENVPIPPIFSIAIPCNSTDCYGMVANSSSIDGQCLSGSLAGMSCTPSCPSTEVSCVDCKGTLANDGSGVCGDPFYAGCPCNGDCPSTPVNCDASNCHGLNNGTSGVGLCNQGTLRGCPCASVCGLNGPCNLDGCGGYNLANGLGVCTGGDYWGCSCTSVCPYTISSCGSLTNCTGIATNGTGYCLTGDYAGCTCDMECPSNLSCSNSNCSSMFGVCQAPQYFGCSCSNTTTTATPTSSTLPTSTVPAGPTLCQGNQVQETNCIGAELPSVTPYSGVMPPECAKADGEAGSLPRINATQASDAVSSYCNRLMSDNIVLSAHSDPVNPYAVIGVAENNSDMTLSILFDIDGCPTNESVSMIDFQSLGLQACWTNFFYFFSIMCAQDSTWTDYNPQFTIEGGVFLNDCGVWSLGAETPSIGK